MRPLGCVPAVLWVLSASTPQPAAAQAPGEGPFWYVSNYEVPWTRVDSLLTLLRDSQPVVDNAIAAGEILDYRVLIHHTGTAANVVVMIKYPS